MSLLSAQCPSCAEPVEVPLDALLLAMPYADGDARMAFICPRCDRLVDQRVNSAGVAVLLSGGCVPIVARFAESS